MKNTLLLAVLACATAAAACAGFEHKSSVSGPSSAAGIAGLMGVWTSATIIPHPDSCTDFVWNASEQTPNSARGTFTATCANGLKLEGNAEGSLAGSTISWLARGKASAADLASCDFTLTGTAQLGTDAITIPYSGTTCLGPVSGTETLHKKK